MRVPFLFLLLALGINASAQSGLYDLEPVRIDSVIAGQSINISKAHQKVLISNRNGCFLWVSKDESPGLPTSPCNSGALMMMATPGI
jgi:hypothetical protein